MRTHNLLVHLFRILFVAFVVPACSSESAQTSKGVDGGIGSVNQDITAQPDPSCVYARYGVHDYWMCSVNKTFSAAKSTCEGVGMHLARIDNSAENDFVKTQLGADSWIGATDSAAEGQWRWVNDSAQFWSGNRPGNAVGGLYNKWTASEPNDLFGEDCGVFVKSSGEWNDIPCSLSRAFVCESSPATNGQPQAPDTACTRSTRNGSTYWTCSNARTWDTARANCQSVGQDLVAIDDASEATFLASAFTRDTHIGLTDKQSEGTWRWTATDRPTFCGTAGGRTPYGTYSNWASGQPIRQNDCQKVESETRSYWVCKNGKTWDAARDECAGSEPGMSLARIDNAAENALIYSKIAVDTWLGATDRAAEGQWRWTDNVQFWSGGSAGGAIGGRYTNFQVTEPNDLFGENCLLMYLDSGKWNDSMCEAPLGGIGFVCEGPKTAGYPDRNDCAYAASGGKWSAGACTTGRAYVCESVPATAKPQLEDVAATITENHALGAPRVLGFDMKPTAQVKEPFVGLEERLGLRGCTDALEPEGTPSIVRSTGLERVTYRQKYEGIPVLGRGYTVLRHPHTKLVQSVLGDVAPKLNVATAPVLTQAQALAKAVASVGTLTSDYNPAPAGALRILPKFQGRNPQWELGWVFSLPRTSKGDAYGVGVSAITGNVLLKSPRVLSCVTAQLPVSRTLRTATVNAFQATSYLDPSTPLVSTGGSNPTYPTFLNSKGTTLDPLETPQFGIRPLYNRPDITATCGNEALLDFAVLPTWSNVMLTTPSPIQYMPDGVSPPTDEQAGAATFLALQTSLDAIASVFENKITTIPVSGSPTTQRLPWIGLDGAGAKRVNLHIGAGGDAYSPEFFKPDGTFVPEFIHIQTAAAPPERSQGAALDVIGHELAHALWTHHSPVNDPEALEGRSIQEGFADIIADTIEAAVRLPKTSSAGQFCQGGDPWADRACDRDHKFPIASTQNSCTLPDGTRTGCCVFNSAGGAIRGGCPSDYRSPEYCTAGKTCDGAPQTEACCDEHTNATVFDHWQYMVTAGDSKVTADSCAYHVKPLAADPLESAKAAGRIVFNAIRDGSPKDLTFPLMAEATMKSATDLFGANSEQVKSVAAAWYAVNVRENPFTYDAAIKPKRGAKKVHPWVTFTWPAGEGETSWDLQVDDKNFQGSSPRFEEKGITATTGTGTSRMAYYSVAFPENVDTHYVWRARPHSDAAWNDCYAIHWFDGTGALTRPTVTIGFIQPDGLLAPGTSRVTFPPTPGVEWDAIKEYKIQFSQSNVSTCQSRPDVPEAKTGQYPVDSIFFGAAFPGTQPGATYYAHVQATGPKHVETKQPALGPCVTENANSGPPQAPYYLRPANGERFNLYGEHERDPESPSFMPNLELSWSVQTWMKSSRVRFRKRTATGCSDQYESVEKIVETPASCTSDACEMTLKPETVLPNLYPGGYCWEVVGIGAPSGSGPPVVSPAASGSWTYFVNMATERSPGVAATSGSPGLLGPKTYNQPATLKWTQVQSATGYNVKVWQWLAAYGTEQLGNPIWTNPTLGPDKTQLELKDNLAPKGRYCWELTPIVEDPATPGQAAAVQPKVNSGGPICFTTGPKTPVFNVPQPPSRGFDGKDITGEIVFDYLPDNQVWSNAGEGWNWDDGPEPWCTTLNQIYKDAVMCKRRVKIKAEEGKVVTIKIKAYDGSGAPGSTPGGTPVFNLEQKYTFGRCGGSKEPCCPSKKCDAATLACDGQDTCVGCGVLNAPCCGGNVCNTSDLGCSGGLCKIKAKPDLQISLGDNSCGALDLEVMNVGDAPTGPFSVTFDGVDCCFGQAVRPTLGCPALGPGGICKLFHHYTCTMASFFIKADSTNVVAESNENNNTIDMLRCADQCFF